MRIYHTCPRDRKIRMNNMGYGGMKKLFLRVKMKYRPHFTAVHIKCQVDKLNKSYKQFITRVMPTFLTQI